MNSTAVKKFHILNGPGANDLMTHVLRENDELSVSFLLTPIEGGNRYQADLRIIGIQRISGSLGFEIQGTVRLTETAEFLRFSGDYGPRTGRGTLEIAT